MKKSGFIEGAIIATIAIFLSKFLGIIYAIPFHKIVGAEGGALYGYAYQIYNIFLVISCAGIPLAISKLISEYQALNMQKEQDYMYKSAKKIVGLFSIISFLLCFIFAPFIAHLFLGDIVSGITVSDITFVIRCVSFAILVAPMLSISRGYLQGHGFIAPSSFSQVIEQVVRIAVILFGSYFVLNILHLSLKSAVGVAVFGACAGGIAAYIYLINKVVKVKNKQNLNADELSKEEKKVIIKKIIFYSLPFIITNIASSIYNVIDITIINRALEYLKFDGNDIITINSIFTTWGSKLNTIVTSIATGLAVSLVPNLAKSNAQNDYKDINDKFNKTIQIFFYVALPLAIFMSIFAKEIWTIFYGSSYYGPIIFRFSILTAALDAFYIMICNGLQGLNKSKLIYLSVLLGLGTNLLLDYPLILLFNKLNIYPYYGAITATLIGYTISLVIPLINLKKSYKLNYKVTLNRLPKLFGTYLIMIFISLIYRVIINDVTNRFFLIGLVGLIGIILLCLYYILNKFEIKDILGKDLFKRKKRV